MTTDSRSQTSVRRRHTAGEDGCMVAPSRREHHGRQEPGPNNRHKECDDELNGSFGATHQTFPTFVHWIHHNRVCENAEDEKRIAEIKRKMMEEFCMQYRMGGVPAQPDQKAACLAPNTRKNSACIIAWGMCRSSPTKKLPAWHQTRGTPVRRSRALTGRTQTIGQRTGWRLHCRYINRPGASGA